MSDAPRHLARIVVLQSLYAAEHGNQTTVQAFESLIVKEEMKDKNKEFARNLLAEVVNRTEWADAQISELAENWKIERIASVDRTIMRMAMVELEVFIDTPIKVVLNEAIELAKEFSTNASSKFINGILDNFIKKQNELKNQ